MKRVESVECQTLDSDSDPIDTDDGTSNRLSLDFRNHLSYYYSPR